MPDSFIISGFFELQPAKWLLYSVYLLRHLRSWEFKITALQPQEKERIRLYSYEEPKVHIGK